MSCIYFLEVIIFNLIGGGLFHSRHHKIMILDVRFMLYELFLLVSKEVMFTLLNCFLNSFALMSYFLPSFLICLVNLVVTMIKTSSLGISCFNNPSSVIFLLLLHALEIVLLGLGFVILEEFHLVNEFLLSFGFVYSSCCLFILDL